MSTRRAIPKKKAAFAKLCSGGKRNNLRRSSLFLLFFPCCLLVCFLFSSFEKHAGNLRKNPTHCFYSFLFVCLFVLFACLFVFLFSPIRLFVCVLTSFLFLFPPFFFVFSLVCFLACLCQVTLITGDNNFAIRASGHGLITTGRPQCDPGRCRMPLCPAPPRPSPFSRGY